MKSITLLAGIAVVLSSLETASAVDLRQYNRQNCNGNRRYCPNIAHNTCCRASGTFVSGSCAGCPDHVGHRVWEQGFADLPEPKCGYSRGVKLGKHPNCISLQNGELAWTGHSWHYPKSRRAFQEDDEVECSASVEPSVYVIGDRWFEVNDTVSADFKKVLLNTWDRDVQDNGRQKLPAELDALETTWRPDDDEE